MELPDFGDNIEVFTISAVRGDGLGQLVCHLGSLVETLNNQVLKA
jgi:hypothetical protein